MEDHSPVPPALTLERARELAQNRRWSELAGHGMDPGAVPPGDAPELAYLLSDALRRVGRAGESVELAERAHAGAVRSADGRLELRAANLLGMIAFDLGDLAAAAARFESLLERASEVGDDEFAARASNNLGVLANIPGRRDLALTFYQRALAAYHRLGHIRGLAQTHYNIGISYRDLGFPEEAERHYVTAIRHGEETGSDDVVAHSEMERAYLRARAGDGALAEVLAGRALAALEAMQDPLGVANALRVLAAAAEASGDHKLALERLEQASEILGRHPDLLTEAEVERDRGRLLLEAGDTTSGIRSLERAVEAFGRLGALEEERSTRALLAAGVARKEPLS